MMSNLTDNEDTKNLLSRVLRPYFEAVGEIASIWAEFENRLDQMIWDLADVEQALGACITSKLNGPAPRFGVLKALLSLREWDQPTITLLNKLSHDIKNPQDARNRAVHDVMLVGLETERVFKRTVATIDNKLIYETVEHSLEALKSVATESRDILKRFNLICENIRAVIPNLSEDKLQKLHHRQGPLFESRLSINIQHPTPLSPPELSRE